MNIKNIYSDIPEEIPEEIIENLFQNKKIRIERIISKGQNSPSGYWYNQDENEWIIILKGSAKLLFKGDENEILLKEGDYINIKAHCEHRVQWTDPSQVTVWLAVFYH